MVDDLTTEDLFNEIAGRAGDFMSDLVGSLQDMLQGGGGGGGQPQPRRRPATAADAFEAAREAARQAARARQGAAQAARGGRQAPPPPPRRDEARELAEAKAVLNFATDARLTREQIKERQRKLAKLFHPDAGGSTAEMQRLNAAAKKLLDMLG